MSVILHFKHFFTFTHVFQIISKVKFIKQHFGNFFLLLAGLIFSAHIVVPHHHHNEQICIGGSYCHSDIFAHSHNSCSQNHQHKGDNTNTCVFQQSYTLPANSGRYDIDSDINSTDLLSPDHLFTVIFKFTENPVEVAKIKATPPDISLPSYTFSPASSGLRAPPAV